jgi:ABC-2 type transport system ATP-binding protein
MIKTENLVRQFGKQRAVDGLNLHIPRGSAYALLGPNGAGKTTTLRLLSTLLAPTEGEIYVDGEKMQRGSKAMKSRLGMVSQHFSLQRDMTPREVLNLHGYLHGMSRRDRKEQVERLIHFAGMEAEQKKLVSELSGGNKRKLMIVRAVMHQPDVLFLDEPTVGLDASIRRSIWDLLKKLRYAGMTIVLTTHYIEEARVLCDRIGMMSQGKIVAEDTPEGFMATLPAYVVEDYRDERTDYSYFSDRESAAAYIAGQSTTATVRRSNLEDAYIRHTDTKGLKERLRV